MLPKSSANNSYKNKKVLIMGLGLNGGGVETARWFAGQEADVLVTDLRSKKILKPSLQKLKNFKNIKFVLGEHREKDFQEADLIIKNPGVPQNSLYLKIVRENDVKIESDFSLFFKLCLSKNLIGVTGSKGKSTTASLIYKIFKKFDAKTQLAGNIRVSPFVILSKIKNPDTPVVLELSSWQLEDSLGAKKSPHIAVITNILHEHLNRYKNFKEYANAKKLIFKFQSKNDFLVLNWQDRILRKIVGSKKAVSLPACSQGKIIFYNKSPKKELAFLKNEKPRILGNHNLENIMASVAVARIFKIPENIIKNVVLGFRGLPGRLEFTKEIGKVKYYNDTTATMPDAAIASIKTLAENFTPTLQRVDFGLKNKINAHSLSKMVNKKNKEVWGFKLKPFQMVLIAGGQDKNLDYKDLAKAIKKYVGRVELLKGDATDKLVKELKKLNFTNYAIYNDLKNTVQNAKKFSQAGGVVLFSPGAASFGMFKNEFDRGDKFNKIVRP